MVLYDRKLLRIWVRDWLSVVRGTFLSWVFFCGKFLLAQPAFDMLMWLFGYFISHAYQRECPRYGDTYGLCLLKPLHVTGIKGLLSFCVRWLTVLGSYSAVLVNEVFTDDPYRHTFILRDHSVLSRIPRTLKLYWLNGWRVYHWTLWTLMLVLNPLQVYPDWVPWVGLVVTKSRSRSFILLTLEHTLRPWLPTSRIWAHA